MAIANRRDSLLGEGNGRAALLTGAAIGNPIQGFGPGLRRGLARNRGGDRLGRGRTARPGLRRKSARTWIHWTSRGFEGGTGIRRRREPSAATLSFTETAAR